MASCAYCFIPVNAARVNAANREDAFSHFTYLHIACMGAKEKIRILLNIKCILHIPGRVMFRKIKRAEIMPVVFYLWSFCYSKSQSLKNRYDPVFHQSDGMARTQWQCLPG